MKLSDLVQFLNYLDQYDLTETHTNSLAPIDAIASMIQKSDCLDQFSKDPVMQSLDQVDTAVQNFSNTVQSLKNNIMQQINDLEKPLFAASTHQFNTATNDEGFKYICGRKTVLVGVAQDCFEQRLKIHSSWQHPGLVFRPIHLSAFREIVSLDPMYLVDTNEALLSLVTEELTDRYKKRIRNYVMKQHSTGRILERLPNHQFGLIAAQDFLNYKPIEFINKLIGEIFYLLKPGGAFVFTYNDCDYSGAVKLAEQGFACYTPGRLIKQHAIKLGFDINYEFNAINGTGILELGKPGQKTSLRGGQTLAVIKEINHEPSDTSATPNRSIKSPKLIDKSTTKHYTEDEKQHLQMSAIIMGIDTEDNIIANYAAEKLDELVTNRLNSRDFNYDKFQKRLEKFKQKRKQT